MSQALIPVIVVPAALVLQFLVQRGITSRYDYRCDNCGQTFSLTPLVATVAPHRFGGSKFVKCPHCGTRSWVSRVPKQ